MKRKTLVMCTAVHAALAGMANVYAAPASNTSAASSGIEEVIITARKTEESVQVVPVAVKALGPADLQKQAVLSVGDLRSSVPGLFVGSNNQGGAPTFAIRAAKGDNGTSDTVTAYIGDVPVASTISVAHMMYDMQSVSVLKGPQGTLFGANSTGGAIIFRPNTPTDKFEGYVDVGVGNFNRTSIQGMVNWPISDTVQLRIAADAVNRDKGFLRNVPYAPIPGLIGSGFNGQKELGTDKHESARVILRIKPSKDFTNDFEYDYFHEDDLISQLDYVVALRNNYTYQTFLGFPLLVNYAALGITPNTGNTVRLDDRPNWNKDKINNYIDTATYEISDRATLKGVLGFQDLTLDTSQSNSGSPSSGVQGRTLHKIRKWTFEPSLDIKSEDGRLRNKTGLFFSNTKTDTGNSYRVVGLPWDQTAPQNNFLVAGVPAWQFAGGFYPIQTVNYYNREFKSHAIYNQVSYDLTKEMTATLGLRYTWDSGNYNATSHINFPSAGLTAYNAAYGNFYTGNCQAANIQYYSSVNLAACTGGTTYKSQAPSFTFTIEDKYAENSMVYATLRGGYLVGGFNNGAQPPVTGMQTTFQPEKVVDFETGLKSDWELWGRPIRTNLAVFYGNYKNQQRQQNGSTAAGATFVGVVNAGASSFYGFDFDGTYEVTDNLELTASWNHVESEYTKFNAIVNLPGVYAYVDLAGHPMSQTPKDQVNLGATVKWPLSSSVGTVKSTLSYYWTDKTTARDSPSFGCTPNAAGQCFGPTSAAVDFRQYDVLKAYDLWNFTTSWNGIMGSNFDANFWVKNLTDKKYDIYNSPQMLQFGYATVYRGEPRTFGVNVKYNF